MKNLLVALAMLTACTTLHAQTVKRELPYSNTSSEPGTMNSYTKTLYTIHIRAVRNFKQVYQHIQNETWFPIPNGYKARFEEQGVRHDIVYDKRGNWLYTIRQYAEDQLNTDIRAQIKTIYFDYTITLVEEIERPLKPLVYVVHMEDKYTIKNIRYVDKEMETVLEVKKAGTSKPERDITEP